jgi:ACT domain-containing protein
MQRLEEIMQSQTIGNNAGSMSQVLDVMASNVLDVTQTTPITGGSLVVQGYKCSRRKG